MTTREEWKFILEMAMDELAGIGFVDWDLVDRLTLERESEDPRRFPVAGDWIDELVNDQLARGECA